MMYHLNPSFFEIAKNLYNAVVVPECLRLLIQFLISHEHFLDQYIYIALLLFLSTRTC